MEPNQYQNESNANNPLKTLYKTLVSRISDQNQGTRTGTVEAQEPRPQYQNRDWTEKSESYQH